MKKLVLFIALIAFGMMAEAQTKTYSLREGQTYLKVAGPFVISTNTPLYYEITAAQPWYTAQSITIAIDTGSTTSVAEHATVAVQLAGRNSDQMAWTNIGSAVTFYPSVSNEVDTVINILNATEVSYRQFRVSVTGDSGATKRSTISNFEFKQFYGLP